MRKSIIKTRLNCSLAIKLTDNQRSAVERLAAREGYSLGEATRCLIERGIEAGIEKEKSLRKMGMQINEAQKSCKNF